MDIPHRHLLTLAMALFAAACGKGASPVCGSTGSTNCTASIDEKAAAGRQQLSGHVSKAMAAAPVVERVPADTKLTLVVGLPVKDRAALRAAVERVSDPRSPSFRHYLAPDQFGEQFGASAADYQAVLDWARASHLTVAAHPNRTVARITGSVGDVETALAVQFHYAERPDGSLFRVPDREPSLALSVPVQHISNLDDYVVPEPAQCSEKTPSPWHNTGKVIRNAYLDGGSASGAGQIIAIDSAGPCFNPSDVDVFAQVNGLGALGFQNDSVVSVNTSLSSCSDPVGAQGTEWQCAAGQAPNGETTMDIEMVTTMAPAATIWLVGGDANLAYYTAHPEVGQISFSHGHSLDSNDMVLLGELALQGQSVFYASGDSGAYWSTSGWESSGSLAEQPYAITSVGGTELDAGSTYLAEEGWFGGGGGIMLGVPIPQYQVNVNPNDPQVSTTYLNAPDVSAVAYNVDLVRSVAPDAGVALEQLHCFGGGTSTSAPLWAGFMALVNQKAQANGSPPMGFVNPALYASAKSFHTITTGSNPTKGCSYDSACNYTGPLPQPSTCACYTTVAGYNLVTGLGSPTPQLLDVLAGLPCGSNGQACAPAPTPPARCPSELLPLWDPVTCTCVAPPTCPCGTYLGSQGQTLCRLCPPP